MSTQKRNIWLDNVKGFLIICVVAGHFLESGIDYHSNMCKSLFLFIYSFHMPLFVFASGLMCEHAIQTKERFCKKLANFAGLYVLLKLLIFPFQRLTSPGLTFSLVKTDGAIAVASDAEFVYKTDLREALPGYEIIDNGKNQTALPDFYTVHTFPVLFL